MHYVIMKDNEKIERLRTKLGAEWRRYHPTGSIVSFSMPALDIPLPVLWPVAKDFKWGFRQQFLGAVYYIRTNNRYVSQIVPMAEHFVMGCVALAEQRYAMQLSITRIVGTATQLAELYRASRRVREATGQPHFRIGMHVYTVTADFAHFLFTARSLLDSLAALLPYLYGPNANRFGSFGDFVGKVCKESPREGDFQDDDVRIHLKEKGEWFRLLRDLRDYATHAGPLQLAMYEDTDGSLGLYVLDRYDIIRVMRCISDGIDDFLSFCDDHFTRLIKAKVGEHMGQG